MQLPPDAYAEQLSAQAQALIDQGRPREAQTLLEQALEAWEQARSPAGAIATLQQLAQNSQRLNLPRAAEKYLQQAIQQSRQLGDRHMEADLLAQIGAVYAGIGERDRALGFYQSALTIYQDMHEQESAGRVLFAIGKAHQEAGMAQQAVTFFQRAFPLLRGTASWTPEVEQTERLADTLAVAQDIFGMFLADRHARPNLDALAARLESHRDAGSQVAERFATALAGMQQSMETLRQTFSNTAWLQRYLQDLESDSPRKRRQAARDLANQRPSEAIEPLFQQLQREQDSGIRAAIILTLGAYKDPAFAERLRPLLQHNDADTRLAAAIVLSDLGQNDLSQQLIDGLGSQDEQLRARAIQQLERLGSTSACDALLPMLQDRDARVRSKAIYALSTLGDPRALDGIIAATRDRYQVVRWAAVRVLGQLGDLRALDALIASLQDSNRDVRRSAATALGKLKDIRATDALSAALTDEWWGVQESAKAALRKLKAAPSYSVLEANLRSPGGAGRAAAIRMLADHYPEASLPLLREQLAASDQTIQLSAIQALSKLRDRESVPAIIALLPRSNTYPHIQIEIIKALGNMQDERAAPAITPWLSSANPYIRFEIIKALGEIGRREDLPALAQIQLHDSDTIHIGNEIELISLKAAAASAMHRIRERHQLTT